MSRSKKQSAETPVASLTAVLGAAPVLPGESAEQYQQGLQSLIQELDAKTTLQIYLAEKIFECLWWMRRYEQQKRMSLAREMASILTSTPSYQHSENNVLFMELLTDPTRQEELKKILKKTIYTEQALVQAAFEKRAATIANLNDQISVMAKNLAGFQASYEVLTNRKFNAERLRLQNELLVKDLAAIELKTQPDESQS